MRVAGLVVAFASAFASVARADTTVVLRDHATDKPLTNRVVTLIEPQSCSRGQPGGCTPAKPSRVSKRTDKTGTARFSVGDAWQPAGIPRTIARRHGITNASLVVLYIINAIVRGSGPMFGPRVGLSITMSVIGVAALMYSGWLGGELVYKHRIAVDEPPAAHLPGQTAAPVTIPFKNEGRTVMLLGGFGSVDDVRFGGTQYAKNVLKTVWGLPPALDMDYEKRVHNAIRKVVPPLAKEYGKPTWMTEVCCYKGSGEGAALAEGVEQRLELFGLARGSRTQVGPEHGRRGFAWDGGATG